MNMKNTKRFSIGFAFADIGVDDAIGTVEGWSNGWSDHFNRTSYRTSYRPSHYACYHACMQAEKVLKFCIELRRRNEIQSYLNLKNREN